MKKCPNQDCKAKSHATGAIYCHLCGEMLTSISHSAIEDEIIEIVRKHSRSKRILAAYKGRKFARKICRVYFGKYLKKAQKKNYVEMLIKTYYPEELEKANFGKQYLKWLSISILLCIPFGIGFLISPFIIWKKVVPTYKQLKAMYK